ncbi:unnamed protein product [Sphagnum balticum]
MWGLDSDYRLMAGTSQFNSAFWGVIRLFRSSHQQSFRGGIFLVCLQKETRSSCTPPIEARAKVKAAEDAWNTCNPDGVALAYTEDSEWHNRNEFLKGREAIKEFLCRKWESELEYHLRKEIWAFSSNHIAVRFEYEWHDRANKWQIELSTPLCVSQALMTYEQV